MEDKAKSKKDSKENDRSKSKPSAKKVEPAKVSAQAVHVCVYYSHNPVFQFYTCKCYPTWLVPAWVWLQIVRFNCANGTK